MRIVGAWVLAASLGPAAQSTPQADPLQTVLLRAISDRAIAVEDVERDLAALGPDVAPALLEIAARGTLLIDPGVGRELAVDVRADLRDAICAALARSPRASLLPRLEPLAAEGTVDGRETALRVLGRIATERDLGLLQRLALTPDEPRSPRLRHAFEDALTETLVRSEQARLKLGRTFEHADASLAFAIVRAAERIEAPASFECLTRLLGWRPKLDLVLLRQIARVATEIDPPVADELLGALRRHLDAADSEHVRAAALALAEVDDFDAVGRLIDLMEHPDRQVVHDARAALRRIVRTDLGSSPQSWRAWHERELSWWSRESEQWSSKLALGASKDAALAILELGRRRLYRDEVVELLAPALERSEPPLIALACHALGHLRSRNALPLLKSAAGHADEQVREAARAAQALIGDGRAGAARASP